MLEGLRGQMVITLPDLDVIVRTGYDKLKANATFRWTPTR